MEFSLPFLAAEKFHYGPTDMWKLFMFLGVTLILVQGGIVRRVVPKYGEKPVMLAGFISDLLAFLFIGLSTTTTGLFTGLALLGLGTGLANPSVSALVSLYSKPEEQGRMLGVFRSLGSLARGVGPIIACLIYWLMGAQVTYSLAALILVVPLVMALPLPKPNK